MLSSFLEFSYYQKHAVVLVFISLLLPCCALTGLFVVDSVEKKMWYGIAEMILILLLFLNGALIWLHLKSQARSAWIATVARWCFLSLAFCVLGDLVNRNFLELYYQHGSNVEHTYLADSVWFFFPGYLCFVYAAYLVGRQNNVSIAFMLMTAVISSVVGVLSFLDLYKEGAGFYVAGMTGFYGSFIPLTCAAAIWLVKSYGFPSMKWVALGAVLATVADAIIGNFWLYRDGYYPAVSYVNWMIYFTSQALIQQLPIKLAHLEAS